MAATLSSQTVKVFSEFRRVDPFGQIVPVDGEGKTREILSPLLPRNAHSTFQVAVSVPAGRIYHFFMQQYPENVFSVTVYKQMYQKHGDTWIPDRLLEIKMPYTSHIPDRYHDLPNQRVECFLVDVWIPRTVAPDRMKLDAQVSMDGNWTIYPMEVRISDVIAADAKPPNGKLAPVTERSDANVVGPVRDYLCGVGTRGASTDVNIRSLIRRNAAEVIAMARALEKTKGKEAVVKGLLQGLEIDQSAFCSAGTLESSHGPEWFLRARDFVFRGKPVL
jgi:hypothetical protein